MAHAALCRPVPIDVVGGIGSLAAELSEAFNSAYTLAATQFCCREWIACPNDIVVKVNQWSPLTIPVKGCNGEFPWRYNLLCLEWTYSNDIHPS